MVIGCGLPLLLIFFAPALGITGYNGLFGFIILMFILHLFMPHGSHGRGHRDHAGHDKAGHAHNKKETQEGTKEEHKGHQHH